MRNIITTILALSLASSVVAKGSSYVPDEAPEAGTVITPAFATGVRQFAHFTNDTAGYMVVCVTDFSYRTSTCGDNNDKWKRITEVIPAGRVFVGFRVIGASGGYLQIYWK